MRNQVRLGPDVSEINNVLNAGLRSSLDLVDNVDAILIPIKGSCGGLELRVQKTEIQVVGQDIVAIFQLQLRRIRLSLAEPKNVRRKFAGVEPDAADDLEIVNDCSLAFGNLESDVDVWLQILHPGGDLYVGKTHDAIHVFDLAGAGAKQRLAIFPSGKQPLFRFHHNRGAERRIRRSLDYL